MGLPRAQAHADRSFPAGHQPAPDLRRGRVGIGLGWLHLNRKDGAAVWHNGGTMGFGSFAAFDPDRDAAVVLLFNSRYLLRTARTALGLLGSLGE